MNRFKIGLSYNFNRNLGKVDRILRFTLGSIAIVSWYFGFVVGILGLVIFILALMILGTAATAKCSIVYMLETNTITKKEKQQLDKQGILYE